MDFYKDSIPVWHPEQDERVLGLLDLVSLWQKRRKIWNEKLARNSNTVRG